MSDMTDDVPVYVIADFTPDFSQHATFTVIHHADGHVTMTPHYKSDAFASGDVIAEKVI